MRLLFPLAYWPKTLQIALAACVVGVVLAVAVVYWQFENAQLHSAVNKQARLQAQVNTLKQDLTRGGAAAGGTSLALAPLPTLQDVQSTWLKDMAAQADKNQVQIASMSIEPVSKTSTSLAQVRVTMQLKAGYQAFKALVSQQLAQNPWLALDQVSLKAEPDAGVQDNRPPAFNQQIGQSGLDVTVVWVMYVQGE